MRTWVAGGAAMVIVAAAAWYLGASTGGGVPAASPPTTPAAAPARSSPSGGGGRAAGGQGAREPDGAAVAPVTGGEASGATGSRSEKPFEVAVIPLADEPLARVNGVALTPARVFPPGVMRRGDELPKVAYDKFLDDAINRAVLVQEAERRGYADDPEFKRLVEQLRADIAGLPDLTQEQREWQVDELRGLALAEQVYRAEGIQPTRVTPEEVEAAYRAHAADYEWVRQRESLRGTSPEKIERRVRDQLRRDLQEPIARETRRRRDALAASLRSAASVQIP